MTVIRVPCINMDHGADCEIVLHDVWVWGAGPCRYRLRVGAAYFYDLSRRGCGQSPRSANQRRGSRSAAKTGIASRLVRCDRVVFHKGDLNPRSGCRAGMICPVQATMTRGCAGGHIGSVAPTRSAPRAVIRRACRRRN